MTKILTIIAVLLLFLPGALAQDTDVNQMTTEELQDYINQLQGEVARPQAPIVVTMQIDQELRESITLLTNEVSQLKLTNQRMQERFAQFVTDNKVNLETTEESLFQRLSGDTDTKLKAQNTEMKEWVRLQTNPVRMNLPAIGVFMILTAVFLLWSSKINQGAS